MEHVARVDDIGVVLDSPIRAVTFDEFYRVTSPRMLRLATAVLISRSAAEDATQDAFANTYARFGSLEDPEAYVRRAVINNVRGVFRRAKVRATKTAVLEASTDHATSGEHDTLLFALDALPSRQRTALILRFYDRCTEAEIADAIGCRPGTVKSLISRGLENLRKVIEP